MEALDLTNELQFKTTRSGGKGGQNVNKLETSVQVFWSIAESKLITEEQKSILRSKLANKINKNDELVLFSSAYRSQLENKQDVINKLHQLVRQSLVRRNKRKTTKIPKSVIEYRLTQKKLNSERKQNRKKWH